MKETRVYVLDLETVENYEDCISDEKFIELAENRGTVYSLGGFQSAFNDQYINTSTDIIRILEV